jgi:hypothetical protein
MYSQVRDLLAAPEWRAQIDGDDLPLLRVLTQVCQEFCQPGPTTLEEPALQVELRRDDDLHQYRLWFLYPPSTQRLNYFQQARIYALGYPYVDASGIFIDVEPGMPEPRLALTVLVTMKSSPVVAETTEKITVATTVVYHPASAVGANFPASGLNVRKLAAGTTFSNTTSPRPPAGGASGAGGKRPRADYTELQQSSAKRPRLDGE